MSARSLPPPSMRLRPSSYVLVVDDNDDIRLSVKDLLREYGFSARPASNGREALDVLQEHGPASVVLLDMMMPVMDGPTFRCLQLADPSLHGIPVIAMTASQQDLTHL